MREDVCYSWGACLVLLSNMVGKVQEPEEEVGGEWAGR